MIHYLSVSAVSLISMFALLACSRSSDEEQIRELVDAAEIAFEARNTSAVMDVVATDYRDELGHDKEQLRAFLRGYFLVHPKIEVLLSIRDIKLETANTARVQIQATMVGTQRSGESSRFTADAEILQVDMRRSNNSWQIVRVERLGA